MSQQKPYEKEWLDNGILSYRFNSIGSETAQEWYTDMMLTYEAQPPDGKVRILIDLRAPANMLSAEAMMRARQLSSKFPDVVGRIAILIDPNENFKNLAMFLDRGLQDNLRARKLFDDEAAAKAWLLEV
ncbi:MAG: hypothetical protein IAE80_03010 [Anaerolinea sp.]|nr:hypothetical protein [Anaerolinea sp.]